MRPGALVIEDAWRSPARHPRGCLRPVRGDIHLRLRATGFQRSDCVICVQALEDGTIVFLQVDDDAGQFATRTTGDSSLDREIEARVRWFVRSARNVTAIRAAA